MLFLSEIDKFMARCEENNRKAANVTSHWGLENSPGELEKRQNRAPVSFSLAFHTKWPWMPPFGANVIDYDLWFIAVLYNTINNLLVASLAKGHLPITQLNKLLFSDERQGYFPKISGFLSEKNRTGKVPSL